MKTRFSIVAALLLIVAVPAWAHCGKCGVGESKEKGHGHAAHGGSHGHAHAHAEIGKPAPEFALKDANGKEVSLASFKGKVVVLEWTNHTCPFVKRHQGQQKTMQKTFAKFAGKPVAWLAIDSSRYCEEKIDGIREWIKTNDIKFPILMDAKGKVGHIYGAKTTPHMYVIDQKGVLAYAGAIDDDPQGDKESPKNYVEDAVNALLKGSTVATARTKSYGCSVKY